MAKDIIIIGGGLAGLYTAHQCQKLGISFSLLEAKDCFGGRILSDNTQPEHLFFHDLGPTWIFPHHLKMQALVKAMSLSLFNQYIEGSVIYHANSNIAPQIINNGQGMELYRVQGGLYQLILALQNQLAENSYQLNSPVKKLYKENNDWHIEIEQANNEMIKHQAKHVVLALPPRIIAQHLSVDLWASKTLIKQLSAVPTWMAAQAKFIATYEQPFWRKKKLSGQAFSRVGPMIEIHDASAEEDNGFALFGFIGLSANDLKDMPQAQVKAYCLKQLTLLFGEEAEQYQACFLKCWGSDYFVATEQDIKQPPAHPYFNFSTFNDELSSLNLSFAGSEFAANEAGYLEGAINAADSVIHQLKQQFL